jgi:hypothetical protein
MSLLPESERPAILKRVRSFNGYSLFVICQSDKEIPMMNFRMSFFKGVLVIALLFSSALGAQAENSRAGTLSKSEALNTAERWASMVGQADIAGLR